MAAFIDEHRAEYGVESIGTALGLVDTLLSQD